MNRVLVENWNNTVSTEDEVFVLGDFALGNIKETLPIAKDLNGKKVLIPGNHDRCWPGNKKWEKWVEAYQNVGFNVIPDNSAWLYYQDMRLLMSHFPYEGDSQDKDRFNDYRPVHPTAYLLHGHVHEKWKLKDRMINVGVDVNEYRPVSLEQVFSYVEQLKSERKKLIEKLSDEISLSYRECLDKLRFQ